MMENEGLIAYCGLCCGDCFGYKGKVADLARGLEKRTERGKVRQDSRVSVHPFVLQGRNTGIAKSDGFETPRRLATCLAFGPVT